VGNLPVPKVVKLPLKRTLEDPPFDTIEHAQAALNQLEVAVELAQLCLTKAGVYGAGEALQGCRSIIATAVKVVGFT
jgi:hypothetical protein